MGKKTKVGKARKDKFYQLAKETGFRSRAAFKLIQLNRKFGFLQQSQVCIDLCAAPGGWMQVAKQNMPVSSIVIGVDLYPIRPISGCITLIEDITTDKCRQSLAKELQTWKADVVLHDGAPNVGRNWLYDAYQQVCLTLMALKLATGFLRGGGWFITKVFRSKDYNALLWVLKQLFKKVHATKPSASRKESAEIFVVCQNYIAPDRIDPRLLDSKYVFEELELNSKRKSSLLHPDKQKRVKAEGYTEEDIALRNELKATEFMKSENGLVALQGISNLKIDDERIIQHPKTTQEILECCKDIKVLGRKDVKGLLAWWKAVKADLFNDENDKVISTIEEVENESTRTITQEEIEDMEDEELQKHINELVNEEQRNLKRKRKKTQKIKIKLQEKMNLKMVIKGDDGPREEAEEEMFDLKMVKTQKELDQMLDVRPDFYVESDIDLERPKLPKYIKYDKEDKRIDDNANYENNDEVLSSLDEESDSDYDKQGLGLSDDYDNNKYDDINKKRRVAEHPLIKSSDFRSKDAKRQQRVQLWYEKENLKGLNSEDDEEYDLDYLANEYKNKDITILGQNNNSSNSVLLKEISKSHNGRLQMSIESKNSSTSESEDDDDGDESKGEMQEKKTKESKAKKIRLTEEELALGAMLIKGRKTRRDLIDSAWNRYAFNDENLPAWFVHDEEHHMKKPLPVPAEISHEYEHKIQELNVRPIKKVMEAKARKRRRAEKRLAKAKKEAIKIIENADATPQERAKQLQKVYKRAQEKKKEVTYVVAKKHQAGRRIKRPVGVKGRYKMVDPRQKKDKRNQDAKTKRNKRKGKK